MKLTEKEVRHIAHLARLQLTAAEEKQYAAELTAILSYVEILQSVPTDKVPATAQVTGLENVWQEDVVQECAEPVRQKLLNQFPARRLDLLSTPGVFNEYKE